MELTLENALDIIEELEKVIRRDIKEVPREDKSMILGIMTAALNQTALSVEKLRTKMEKSGESTPISEEQKLRLRQIIGASKSVS